jgi:hypothetical protein
VRSHIDESVHLAAKLRSLSAHRIRPIAMDTVDTVRIQLERHDV